MFTADDLLAVIDAYRKARDVSDARVSTLLFNDGKRVGMLRKGGDIGSRYLVTAFQWLSDHWPSEAVWPKQIDRPIKASPPAPSAPTQTGATAA